MIKTAFLAALCCAVSSCGMSPAFASEKPSATFCWLARQARDAAGGERAAEDVARARGVSEATITKAKRCSR